VSAANPGRRRYAGLIWLGGFTIVAVVLLISLGNWQVRRLAYKTTLAIQVTHRLGEAPVALPPPALWPAIDPELTDYTPVRVTGHYRFDREFHVFATLLDPKGPQGGVGWWIFTPLVEADGTTLIVNRGFVPDARKEPATRAEGQIAGEVTVTGLLRRPEGSNAFTPANDIGRNRWFTRDPVAMAQTLGLAADRILPFYIDAGKSTTSAAGLPQAGETIIDFSNNHLGYALTWYGLALAAAGVFGAFAWKRLRQ